MLKASNAADGQKLSFASRYHQCYPTSKSIFLQNYTTLQNIFDLYYEIRKSRILSCR